MITQDHKFPDFINEIFIDIPDCIGLPEDHEYIIKEICKITEGQLVLEKFASSAEEPDWRLKFTVSGQDIDLKIQKSKYFNTKIGEALNQVLEDRYPEDSRILVIIQGGPHYDFGYCFTSPENEYKLVEKELIWRSGNWKENYLQGKKNKEVSSPVLFASKGPELWMGDYKEENRSLNPFKFKILENKDGEIKGMIYEGNDFEAEQKSSITFEGTKDNENITFTKFYGVENYTALRTIMNISDKDIQNLAKQSVVKFVGKINGDRAFGTWTKDKVEFEALGNDLGEAPKKGIWSMKKVRSAT